MDQSFDARSIAALPTFPVLSIFTFLSLASILWIKRNESRRMNIVDTPLNESFYEKMSKMSACRHSMRLKDGSFPYMEKNHVLVFLKLLISIDCGYLVPVGR